MHKEPGGHTSRTAGPRDVPQHVASCGTIKLWGKKEEAQDVHSYGFCLPNKPSCGMKPCFCGTG